MIKLFDFRFLLMLLPLRGIEDAATHVTADDVVVVVVERRGAAVAIILHASAIGWGKQRRSWGGRLVIQGSPSNRSSLVHSLSHPNILLPTARLPRES